MHGQDVRQDCVSVTVRLFATLLTLSVTSPSSARFSSTESSNLSRPSAPVQSRAATNSGSVGIFLRWSAPLLPIAPGRPPSVLLPCRFGNSISVWCMPAVGALLFKSVHLMNHDRLDTVGCDRNDDVCARNRMPLLSKASNIVQEKYILYDVTGFTQKWHSRSQHCGLPTAMEGMSAHASL